MPAAKIFNDMSAKLYDVVLPEEEEHIRVPDDDFDVDLRVPQEVVDLWAPITEEEVIEDHFCTIFRTYAPDDAFRLACEYALSVGYKAMAILLLNNWILYVMRIIDKDWVVRLYEHGILAHRRVLDDYEAQQLDEIYARLSEEAMAEYALEHSDDDGSDDDDL